MKLTIEGLCDSFLVLGALQSLSDLTYIKFYVLLTNLLLSSKNGRRPS